VFDLRELAAPGIVSANLSRYLQAEVERRTLVDRITGERHGEKPD
jgi:hypothetical protein